MTTKKELKARKICAKLQLRAYKKRWNDTDKKRWDRMILIIKRERER